MTTLVWTNLRDRAVDLFGEYPKSAQLEQDIINQFELHPHAVQAVIERISEQPGVRNPWGLLHHELCRRPSHNPTVDLEDATERQLRVRQAEALIRNTGHLIPSEEELLDLLFAGNFDDRGATLRPWAGDEQLRQRLTAQWQKRKPDEDAA